MKIVIGTDGSEFSKAAIQKACDIADDRDGVEIIVISTYELLNAGDGGAYVSMPAYTQEIINGMAESAESLASDARDLIRQKCPKARVHAKGVMGRASAVIIEEAEEQDADLIIVGSHGLGFWGRALLGSVSNRVVHYAPCSVLVVRANIREG